MTKALLILLSAVLTVGVAWSLGGVLLRRLDVRLYREEQHLFGLMAGFGMLSAVVFGLASLHLAYMSVFAVVGLGALVWGRLKRPAAGPPLPPLPRVWASFFWIPYGMFGLLYLINALAPELSPDGSTYHLGLVSRYFREHGFPAITNNMYANLSQGVDMLFLFAFAFGKHSAAALVHCSFLLALPLLILGYARRSGFPRAGVGAALFVFASPIAGITGTSAYNDVAIATLLFACFYLLEIWSTEKNRNLLLLAGLIAGFCYATKYTAFLAVPYALGTVAWRLRGNRGELFRSAALVSICALAMALPWMVKNAVIVDNPFSPFLNSVFPNPCIDPSFEKNYVESLRKYSGLKSYADIPMEATVRGEILAGFVGPLFLLAPVALFALRWPVGRRLLLAGLIFALPYAANVGTRFLLPALPFLSLAMALALERVPGALPVLILAHTIASWPGVTSKYCAHYAWRLEEEIPFRAALRKESQDEYLTRHRLEYRVARMVERAVPKGEKVFAFSPLPEAYITHEVVTGGYSTPNTMLREALWIPSVSYIQPTQMIRFPFSGRRLLKIRLVQTAADETGQWSITELYLFRGGTELQRKPAWRITAQPNPWEATLALDNSAVTRWSSRRTLRPGMFFEVDLPDAQVLDSVAVRSIPDQRHARLRLEGQGPGGQWQVLNGEPQVFEVDPPLEMRRMAIEELLARGIRYIAVADFDIGYADFSEHAELWGLKLAGEEPGTRLFEIRTPQK